MFILLAILSPAVVLGLGVRQVALSVDSIVEKTQQESQLRGYEQGAVDGAMAAVRMKIGQ